MNATILLDLSLVGMVAVCIASTYLVVLWRRATARLDAQLLSIRLHQPPISVVEVRELVRKQPDFYPMGTRCAYCRRDPPWLFEMYPVELIYQLEPHVSISRYVYCCTPAHAAHYMLSWWEPPPGTLAVDIPKGQ